MEKQRGLWPADLIYWTQVFACLGGGQHRADCGGVQRKLPLFWPPPETGLVCVSDASHDREITIEVSVKTLSRPP